MHAPISRLEAATTTQGSKPRGATGAQGPCSKWVGGRAGGPGLSNIPSRVIWPQPGSSASSYSKGNLYLCLAADFFPEQDTPFRVVDHGPGLMIPRMARSAGRMAGYIHHCGSQCLLKLLCTATSPRPANADSRALSCRPTQLGGRVFVHHPRETPPLRGRIQDGPLGPTQTTDSLRRGWQCSENG